MIAENQSLAAGSMVYVVDDDIAVRASLAYLLESAGFSVETFGSAKDFLGAGPFERVGCIILDVRMPDVSGLELQQKLAMEHIDLPVIFVSADTSPAIVDSAMRAGALRFFPKPLDASELLSAVDVAITGHRHTLGA